MKRTRWRTLLLLGALSHAVPVTALAQASARYEEARSKAKQAFAEGRYDDAARYFRDAFEAEPRGNLLYNIGLCYEKAGDITNAVMFYQRYVEAVPGAPNRPAIQRQILELKKQLQGRYVEVSVSSQPPGATIFVDDKSKGAMGTAPITFQLLPGNYTIIGELQGHEAARRTVEVRDGLPATVDLRPVPNHLVGSVRIMASEVGAEVKVDGQRVGRTPVADPLRLKAGRHELEVNKQGVGQWKQTVEVQAGKEQTVTVDFTGEVAAAGGDDAPAASSSSGGGGRASSSSGGGAGIWPWVTVGAGAAALGGALFTGLSSSNLHAQLAEKRDNNELIARSDIDAGNNLVLMTNVLIGVGSAAVIGGLAWWWFGDSPVDAAGRLETGFGVTPDGGGAVQLWGTF